MAEATEAAIVDSVGGGGVLFILVCSSTSSY